MIRVLHVIDHLGLGGAQTALLDMLDARDRAAFDVEVAVMHGRGHFADDLERIGVRVHGLSRAKWPPSYIPAFLRLIGSEDFQILHFHLQGANWIAKPLAALAGHRVRLAHDHASGNLKFRRVASLLPDAIGHLFSTRVIAVSDETRGFLTRFEAVPHDCVVTIPNGVKIENFGASSAAERAAARARWQIPRDAFVVGSMGRLAPEKNFAMLPELARRHPGALFVVAGSGPEKERLLATAAGLGVSERIRLPGAITDRSAFYRALDVFVLPSLYEGLPMTLLEAMASCVPVLSSRLEGIAAVLTDEKDGLLAEPGNADAFDQQLTRLRDSQALREELAHSARARVESDYASSGTARRIESLYRRELNLANMQPDDRRSVQ